MIIPASLQLGDEIRIISPSGKIDPIYIDQAKLRLENSGFKVSLGNSAKGSYGRFGGSAEERIADLVNAFEDRNVKAILCSRGGYGVMQILDKIPTDIVMRNPKWVLGYSDITALHAFMQTNGIASIHSPMARHLAEENDHSTQSLCEMLLGEWPAYEVAPDLFNRVGECSGVLRGGNLSMLMALRATPWDIDPSGIILFIEDIGERPYQVERMLLNLKYSGILANLSGLIVGQFTDYEEDESMMCTMKEMIANLVANYGYPVVFNFPVGHVTSNLPLFCGIPVQLKIGKKVHLSFANYQ